MPGQRSDTISRRRVICTFKLASTQERNNSARRTNEHAMVQEDDCNHHKINWTSHRQIQRNFCHTYVYNFNPLILTSLHTYKHRHVDHQAFDHLNQHGDALPLLFRICGLRFGICFPKVCAVAMTWDLGWVVCVTAARLVRTTVFGFFTPVSEVDPKP